MLRLRQICLVARELESAVADLKAVFGITTCHRDPTVEKFGLVNALLPVGNNFLEVVAPFRKNTAAERYLDRRKGDGGYMVILQCDDIGDRQARFAALGVRVVNHMQYETYEGLQLHPRDTGGAILETSCNAGNGAPNGPWHPAGPNWQDAVRTDWVTAITAAELQSENPSELAARWGEILAIQPLTDGKGSTLLPLENAVLRFVPAMDERGEGLSGLDISVANKLTLTATAKKYGYSTEGNIITICGTRFKLIG